MWKVPAIDQGTFTEREAKISVMVTMQVCRDCMVVFLRHFLAWL